MKRETQDRKYRKALAQTYDPRVSCAKYYDNSNRFKGKPVSVQCRRGRRSAWRDYYAPMLMRSLIDRRAHITDKEVQEVLRYGTKENNYEPACLNEDSAVFSFEAIEYEAQRLLEELREWEADEKAYYNQLDDYYYQDSLATRYFNDINY